jgi:hypothetical protein
VSIEELAYAGVSTLRPFLALCLACGREVEISMENVPTCECGERRWGLASCSHCRMQVPRRRGKGGSA